MFIFIYIQKISEFPWNSKREITEQDHTHTSIENRHYFSMFYKFHMNNKSNAIGVVYFLTDQAKVQT